MNKIKPLLNKWVLLILCIALACTQVNRAGIVNFNQTDNMPQETVYDNNTNTTETTENIETYYQNDKICIYNYNQLKQIGSDAYVYTGDKDGSIGSGEVVKNEGTELRYTSDAQYVLMSDIEMSTDYIWTLQITLLVALQVQLEKVHHFIIKKQIPLLSITPIS